MQKICQHYFLRSEKMKLQSFVRLRTQYVRNRIHMSFLNQNLSKLRTLTRF